MSPRKITVLISGSGTNLQALIDAIASQQLQDCSIIRVISNRKSAYGLTRAKDADISTYYQNLLEYKRKHPNNVDLARQEYDRDLAKALLEDQPDLVVCAGWMHILSSTFLDSLKSANVPIINLHPALPGAYNGANAIERAHKDFLDGKSMKMGVMIHYVIDEVDMGEPIVVKDIPFEEGDRDLSVLTERVHRIEHGSIVEGTRIALSKLPSS